jgi:hypothetical protein
MRNFEVQTIDYSLQPLGCNAAKPRASAIGRSTARLVAPTTTRYGPLAMQGPSRPQGKGGEACSARPSPSTWASRRSFWS